MTLSGKLEIAGITDVGRKRSHNEDTIASDPELGVAILCDGMGGYKAGEVASQLAVQLIMDDLRNGLPEVRTGPTTDDSSGYSPESLLLRDAIEKANETIFRTAQNQPQCQGMGTTLVSAAFYDDRMAVAHVGDSRLYRLRVDVLEQLTSDHSLLQELVDKGFYTPEEAKQSLNKNLVTRAVGIELKVTPDLQEEVVLPGDLYLLCSDGLSDLVSEDEIHLTLGKYSANLGEAAKALVQLANDHGGKDNISVILVRAVKPFAARKSSWYSRVLDWF